MKNPALGHGREKISYSLYCLVIYNTFGMIRSIPSKQLRKCETETLRRIQKEEQEFYIYSQTENFSLSKASSDGFLRISLPVLLRHTTNP